MLGQVWNRFSKFFVIRLQTSRKGPLGEILRAPQRQQVARALLGHPMLPQDNSRIQHPRLFMIPCIWIHVFSCQVPLRFLGPLKKVVKLLEVRLSEEPKAGEERSDDEAATRRAWDAEHFLVGRATHQRDRRAARQKLALMVTRRKKQQASICFCYRLSLP